MIKLVNFTAILTGLAVSITTLINPPADKNELISTPMKTAKWTTLFDGKTIKGWHTYGKNFAGSAWKIEDGTLMLDPTVSKESNQRGDLVTDKEYENFHLKLEWKISDGGNSGIIFLINEDKKMYNNTYNTGPEMQVLDNEKHPDGKIIKHRSGDLYDLLSSKKETVKPVGQWNKAEITLKNGKLDFYLNGQNVVSTTMWDNQWKDMVAKSKFGKMPSFATFKKGKIALQDHGNKVWYRNIKIKEL